MNLRSNKPEVERSTARKGRRYSTALYEADIDGEYDTDMEIVFKCTRYLYKVKLHGTIHLQKSCLNGEITWFFHEI